MASLGMPRKLKALFERVRHEDGQALVEYALLISLVAIVCVAAVGTMGLRLSELYNHISSVYPR